MTDWLAEAKTIENELIELRRTIHRHPEGGNEEFVTVELLIKELDKIEDECRRNNGYDPFSGFRLGPDKPFDEMTPEERKASLERLKEIINW